MKALLLAFLTVCLAVAVASSAARFAASAETGAGTVSQGSIVDRPQVDVSEGPLPGYSQVVDNATEGGFEAPGWEVASGGEHYAGDYAHATPSGGAAPGRFKLDIPESGRYTVYARWPAAEGNAAAARFGVSSASGTEWTEVDQRKDGGMWVRLGAYEMEAGERNAVQVAPGSGGDGAVVADAVVVLSGEQGNPEEAAGEKVVGSTTLRAAGGRPTGGDVVRRARKHIGTRYRESPPHPCKAYRKEDCSCHTKTVFRTFGRKLPDNPPSQYRYGRKIKRSNLRPGDLVFFDENRNGKLQPWDHVGIYSGNGHLVHASGYFGKVVERKMKYIKGYWGARRLNLD